MKNFFDHMPTWPVTRAGKRELEQVCILHLIGLISEHPLIRLPPTASPPRKYCLYAHPVMPAVILAARSCVVNDAVCMHTYRVVPAATPAVRSSCHE